MHLDYTLVLLVLLTATGLIWLTDVAWLRRMRHAHADATLATLDRQAAGRHGAAVTRDGAMLVQRSRLRERLVRAPHWVELAVGFFPVLLAIVLIRSFVFEPFRIPSGSMLPTLEVGDFIVVNKFAYGLRPPLVDRDVLPIGAPRRGDVVVFRYPVDPSQDYVKRVVGLPGDTIVYRDKRLTIDGRAVPLTDTGVARNGAVRRAHETLPREDGVLVHDILLEPHRVASAQPMLRFPFFEQCRYSTAADAAVTCVVPPGHYFVMGDNRDDSADSRYWGFVPDANLIGRASFVWMNFGHPRRIGTGL